jgi:ribosomal protein S17E
MVGIESQRHMNGINGYITLRFNVIHMQVATYLEFELHVYVTVQIGIQ